MVYQTAGVLTSNYWFSGHSDFTGLFQPRLSPDTSYLPACVNKSSHFCIQPRHPNSPLGLPLPL